MNAFFLVPIVSFGAVSLVLTQRISPHNGAKETNQTLSIVIKEKHEKESKKRSKNSSKLLSSDYTENDLLVFFALVMAKH